MTDVHALVERIDTRWRPDGVRLSIDGHRARLEVDGAVLERRWTRIEDERSTGIQIPHDELEHLLVIGERIVPSIAERLRTHDGWYIDAGGNAFVRAPGIRIDVRGRKPLTPTRRVPERAAQRETNLMSARRSQVIFCLLNWPDLVGMPVRTIARVSGASVSVVHSTVKALVDDHFLPYPGHERLDRRDELLDQWAAAFPLGLGRALELGRFIGEPDLQAFLTEGVDFRVSGEAAADGIRGPDVTLYVPELSPSQIARSRWRRPEREQVANIVIRHKFWTDPWPPDPSTEHIAPALLVYADLLASREPRQREVAMAMRGALT